MKRAVRKFAMYKGYRIKVLSEDEEFFYVFSSGEYMPDDIFEAMDYPGRGEYWGKIRKPAPELEFLE